MKILYMVNVPSPYMVNYFNELGKYCELTVLFDKATSTERDDSWKEYNFKNFKGIILKGVSTDVDAAFCPSVIKYLKKDVYDYIFISNMATPTGIIAIEYLRWKKIDYFLESEGGFAKDGKGFKEKIKKHIMSGAKLYFSTTPVGDEYFLMYGATKDKLVKYPFTSIYEKDILKKVPSVEEKKEFRNELSIKEEKVIITVGQFIPRKGFDILLKACEKLSKNIGVYLVGGTPTDEYIQMKEQLGLDNVHFVGFKRTDELAKYYQSADLFVFPTREDVWGLVINEAMAYNIGGYDIVYCVVLAIPLYCLVIEKKVTTGIKKFLEIFIFIISLIFIVKTQYTTAMLLEIVSFGMIILIRKFDLKRLGILALLGLIILSVYKGEISNGLIKASYSIESQSISQRLEELAKALDGGKVTGEDMTERGNAYGKSIEAFLEHPVLGTWISSDNIELGGHSTVLDLMAGVGLPGFLLILYTFFYIEKLMLSRVEKEITRKYVGIFLVVYIILAVVNPIISGTFFSVLFIGLPGIVLMENK